MRYLLIGFLLVVPGAYPQNIPTPSPISPPSSVRDAQAITIIQNALAAMGSVVVIGQVQNSITSGTSVDQPAGQSGAQSFTWTYAGSEFRNENDAATGLTRFCTD